jgi:glycosyltransferase involved in cell wall biosynthesis
VVVLQWWSGTVLHSYIALALAARLLGAQVVIEYHEVLDTGEARLLLAKSYVALGMPLLRSIANGFVVHSEYDREVIMGRQNLRGRPVMVIHVRAFDDYKSAKPRTIFRDAPPTCCNMLFFGVIRPFKGLEDVLAAFESIPEGEIGGYWLTVVGETWEGWTLPVELITKSKYASRITFVNRYVHDDEVSSFFAGADVALAPYHRSSVSGPLDIAMSWGLPVIVTNVGGLTEAVSNYEGAILVPPKNPVAIQNAMKQAVQLRGRRFTPPHTWDAPISLYDVLFATVADSRSTAEKTSA